ncbi:MAG: DUF177 domain-containing protein [Candidatus Omnitrophica bacterium]|nr:DUF177 domain-containing protein [Candidatus Omnitrophota bacterium]
MQIEIEKIRDEPIAIEGEISASELDIDTSDAKLIGNLKVNCSLQRIIREILADFEISFSREIMCSRCLNKYIENSQDKFRMAYNTADFADSLNVNDDIRERILLNFPMKLLCKTDCKGICPNCGVDLNSEQCQCK